MAYRGKSKGSYGMKKVRQVQARRSNSAKKIDAGLRAPIAKTPEQWLAHPNRYDLPNVDTPKIDANKPKNAEKSCRVSKAYFWENDNANKIFERLVNKDNIDLSIPTNRKALAKLLEILEENKIPYYEDETVGVQVLKTDFERAEKLTNKYSEILYKSVQ